MPEKRTISRRGDHYSWNGVDPARPWQPLRIVVHEDGITVRSRGSQRERFAPWTDVLDVEVNGVSGFWGLRMAVVVTIRDQEPWRFLCPRYALISFPHALAVDTADQIRRRHMQG